ncbi:hypothetical protein ACIRVF_34255 [Kitasatospora sp. NPDC101157]|uniref:hypothetical protein n=1 Tax=Kitasatospora sp. NPDC101157 TaxID=3364098 RepID=UPI00380F4BEF
MAVGLHQVPRHPTPAPNREPAPNQEPGHEVYRNGLQKRVFDVVRRPGASRRRRTPPDAAGPTRGWDPSFDD